AVGVELKVKVALRVRDEPASEEGPPKVRNYAALALDQVWCDTSVVVRSRRADEPNLIEDPRQFWLCGNGDEIVVGSVQHALAHRKLGLQVVDFTGERNHLACHRRILRCNLYAVAPTTRERE